ncbi:hypothetical protein IWW45_000992 [Coemansia sp. RSA 485]|nr:hypothetical protein IWW45_000992 [Coemansia sp. RSA 485]
MSSSPETTAAAAAAPAATIDAAQVPKVFVGNLPYKTNDEQLKAFFSDVGEVVEVRVIMRGTRSMGYGFVSFADLATVNKAVAAKDQAELEGRPLKVEVARPPSKEAGEEGSSKPARRRQPRRKTETKGEAQETKEAKAAEAPAKQSGAENSADEAKPEKSKAGRRANPRRQRRFPKKDSNPDSAATDSPNAEPKTESKGASKAAARAAAKAAARANAKPSETVIYVGNLPYSTTDEELSKLFSDFSISSAHVVVAKKTNRHKGYGFVTLANAAEQLKVIERFSNNPIVVNERILNISPALSEYPASTDQASEGEATA